MKLVYALHSSRQVSLDLVRTTKRQFLMLLVEKVNYLLKRGQFVLFGTYMGKPYTVASQQADGTLTVLDETGKDGFTDLVPELLEDFRFRYQFSTVSTPVADFEESLEWRFAQYCHIIGMNDETVSQELGRPIAIEELTDPADFKRMFCASIGL